MLRRLGMGSKSLTRTTHDKWDEFIHWAKKYHEWELFDEHERDYKLEIVKNIRAAREALQSESDDWLRLLKRSFGSPNNLTVWRTHGHFLDWCESEPNVARSALTDLWLSSELPELRLAEFLRRFPREAVSGMGGRVNIASFLLMVEDPYQFPIYRVTPFHKGFRKTGFRWPDPSKGEQIVYPHGLDFLDQILEEAASRGLDLRDRLDAQSVLWAVTQWGFPLDHWSDSEKQAYRLYMGAKPPVADPEPTPEGLQQVANHLLLDHSYLERVDQLIRAKKQLIFYGPPGTGKTYVARELARHYAAEGGSVELVQFHPSYAYEDFVEGYRPRPAAGGQPGFELVPGPLKRIAEAAAEDPDATHVLVIDEINRGNVAKLLGELYFLLEYRDEEISLQYSNEPFTLPENLWIIGTMNTADRSIALIDAALRRRFYFVPFMPDEPPIQGLLRRWLRHNMAELEWVADAVDRANEMMGDRHMAIGPSYFMKPDLDEQWVDLIWEHSILPYIAEQYFGEEERLNEFRLDRLRGTAPAREVNESEPDAPAEPA